MVVMSNVEIPNWLKGLPLAPEFRPTDTEFADPIAYISKIEKEASAFGICKVIPPMPKPSKRYVLSNLNKSLAKSPDLWSNGNSGDGCLLSKMDNGDRGKNDGEVGVVFTTRHQELGLTLKRNKGAVQPQPSAVQKQVWQSGEVYTLEQFESKSKAFARSQLSTVKDVSPLSVEAMFWKAASEKPIYVEYANDVPGSGFGEPEGSFRYFRRPRRRRKRMAFDRNSRGNSDCNKHQMDSVSNSNADKEASAKNDSNICVEASKASTCSPAMLSDQTSRSSRQKGSNAGHEMEGTSGWKLSNSRWNLQMVARSPGSLTRFMPDDIPGVTSPMVYIGMLFSWFAWHVEDHELHSLNFLHTGSPKTWYAVPGHYAFSFEEVIRNQAYGGNIDRFAALTLLGEKTTLLSPEVVVASGIPCCRLIQNPGEFVVTFPRAYHIGFSHGFNCGEAANFGTPQWLTVAKEAAVRRAAMNYLPMLSHQQLLHLLTMSFVSRVPRSLLPGARSSRLRDRHKEEREMLVKKAFIEDILNENTLFTILLQKSSFYRGVLWDLDALPTLSKESELCSSTSTVAITQTENVSSEKDTSQDLFSQMTMYMETVNDLYLDDDDVSCDFQIDSGSLPCVACGILGFPFMSVVQPSEKASVDLLHADHRMIHDLGCFKSVESHFPSELNDVIEFGVGERSDVQDKSPKGKISSESNKHIIASKTPKSGSELMITKNSEKSSLDTNSFSSDATDKMKPNDSNLLRRLNGVSSSIEDRSPVLDLSKIKFEKGWNTSIGFLRPRIFCLEHAIQIEELLHSKGGANVLVICHSDFQKIKAHTASVSEEIGRPFNYNEVSLDNASQEDLNLINVAIDDEERDERGEDWTARLGVNLRHCVKVRKNFPSEKVQHALTLGGLFCDTTPSPNSLSLKWQSRKFRSKRSSNHPKNSLPSERIQITKSDDMGAKSNDQVVRKEDKIIQYSRRRTSKPRDSAEASNASAQPKLLLPMEMPAAEYEDPDKNSRKTSENNPRKVEDTGTSFLTGNYKLQHRSRSLLPTVNSSENAVPSQVADSLVAAIPVDENVEAQIRNNTFNDIILKDGPCDSALYAFQVQHQIEVSEGSNEKNERCYSGKSSSSSTVDVERTGKTQIESEDQIMEEIGITNEACGLLIEDDFGGQCENQDDEDVLVKQCSDSADTFSSRVYDPAFGSLEKQMEKTFMEKICMNNEVLDRVTLESNLQQEIQTDNNWDDVLIEGVSDPANPSGSCAVEPAVGSSNEPMEKTVVEKSCMKNEVLDCTSDESVQEGTLTVNERTENNHVSCNLNESSPFLVEESVEVPRETHVAKELQGDGENSSLQDTREADSDGSTLVYSRSTATTGRKRKRKREVELQIDLFDSNDFIRSPCEGLRPRAMKSATRSGTDSNKTIDEKPTTKKVRKFSDASLPLGNNKLNKRESNRCDLEGCRMRFKTKAELLLHKRNRCPHEGCRKKFNSHKYALLHQRVHDNDRPLKCPWKGCTMSFKWAWARTEHLRVHTGARPYECKVDGCGLTFRFISDFSRHRRKTGHYVNLPT